MIINPITASHQRKTRTVTTSGPVFLDDDIILVNCTGGAVTLTFPRADANANPISVKKIDATLNAVTMQSTDGHTMNGNSSEQLAWQDENCDYYPDGVSNWQRFN